MLPNMWDDLNIRNKGVSIVHKLKENKFYYCPGYNVDEIQSALIELERYYNTTGDDFLTKYCTMHLMFVAIHPLKDGNGRYARSHFGVIWNEQLLRSMCYHEYNIAILRGVWQTFRTHKVDVEPLKTFMVNHPELYSINS